MATVTYFCIVHGMAWAIVWLGLPMGMMPQWVGAWLWRLCVGTMLLLMGGV